MDLLLLEYSHKRSLRKEFARVWVALRQVLSVQDSASGGSSFKGREELAFLFGVGVLVSMFWLFASESFKRAV